MELRGGNLSEFARLSKRDRRRHSEGQRRRVIVDSPDTHRREWERMCVTQAVIYGYETPTLLDVCQGEAAFCNSCLFH